MQLSDFDFPFDPALVADRPVEPRDWARLLVVRRGSRTHSHRRVTDLPALLNPGDLVVVNDTKVVPVRISGRKRPGGGRIDLVLVKNLGGDTWEALLKGGGKPGQVIDLASEAQAIVVQSDSFRTVIKLMSCRPIYDLLQEIGLPILSAHLRMQITCGIKQFLLAQRGQSPLRLPAFTLQTSFLVRCESEGFRLRP
ncbi:MAG: hypothetical protein C4294_11360 [Nitrospiraceae bacterium]